MSEPDDPIPPLGKDRPSDPNSRKGIPPDDKEDADLDFQAFFDGFEAAPEDTQQSALPGDFPTQKISPESESAPDLDLSKVSVPIDERDLPPEWKTILSDSTESAPAQSTGPIVPSEDTSSQDNDLGDRWMIAMGDQTSTPSTLEESSFTPEISSNNVETGLTPFLESWDVFSSQPESLPIVESLPIEPIDISSLNLKTEAEEPASIEGLLPTSEQHIYDELPPHEEIASQEELPTGLSLPEIQGEVSDLSSLEAEPLPETVSQEEEIPDFSTPQLDKLPQMMDETDWQNFFTGKEGEPVQFESAPGVEPANEVAIPGLGIKISFWDRLRQSFHLTKSEWIAIAAVTTLALLSLGTLFVIRVIVPVLTVKPTTVVVLPTQTIPPSSAIYPSKVEFGGGIKIDLGRGATSEGKWEPKTAEWLIGSELRKVIAIPASKETQAIVESQSVGDKITLHMNNATTLTYKITEVKEVDRNQSDILTDTRPSVVIILFQAGIDKRWVIIARQ